MRKTCRKILGSVPCARRKSLPTDSIQDMEEILRTKLSTIKEEPECCVENLKPRRYKWMNNILRKKNAQAKDGKRGGCLVVPHVDLNHTYVLFISGFASKGTFGGFLQY
ncbi:hypothetical protein K1719_036967 [Acacia pycnantha]|nr:hypothetical protein K1719_036967 [Acacia pycnantha]